MRHCCLPGERCGTLPTELRLGRIRKRTLRTTPRERGRTFNAELHPLGIVSLAAWALHGYTLRHGRGAAGVCWQTFQCALLTSVSGMRCQYSRCVQVSSEKHTMAEEAGVEKEG